jgi:hypothetical protein
MLDAGRDVTWKRPRCLEAGAVGPEPGTRRWPPAGQSGEYVWLRGGASAPIPRKVAGDEFEPIAELPPLVAWSASRYWTRPERKPISPYDWRPAPQLPASLRPRNTDGGARARPTPKTQSTRE